MSGCFISVFVPMNFNIAELRISALSNSLKNIIYTLLIALIVAKSNKPKTTAIAVFITMLPFKASLLPALTNTMFSIHPPLLYLSIVVTIAALGRRLRWLYTGSTIVFFVSMFLGGYWSMQELSWGG